MGILSSIFSVIDKFIPGRKEAYADELNSLLVQYQKALEQNRDTDAALIRKRMVVLRQKLGFTQGEI